MNRFINICFCYWGFFITKLSHGFKPRNCNHHVSLTLSQTTDFRLFQTERVCRRQYQFWSKWQNVFQTGRKRCGKRRNCSLWAISPFPSVFSKDLYCRHVKTRACLGKGLTCFIVHLHLHSCRLTYIRDLWKRILTLSQTVPGFYVPGMGDLWKKLLEKEKMLVTIFFFFSNNVFYPIKDIFYFLNHSYFVVFWIFCETTWSLRPAGFYVSIFICWLVWDDNITEMFLTHCHKMPHFDALKIYSCRKHCEKRRNSL